MVTCATFAPAQKRKYGIFGPGMVKNSIRNMEIKRTTPEHVFVTCQFTRARSLYKKEIVTLRCIDRDRYRFGTENE